MKNVLGCIVGGITSLATVNGMTACHRHICLPDDLPSLILKFKIPLKEKLWFAGVSSDFIIMLLKCLHIDLDTSRCKVKWNQRTK